MKGTASTLPVSQSVPLPDKLYFKIGEVEKIIGVKAYVLRYWETEFPDIVPPKSRGKQRLYRRRDIERILQIKQLLYRDKFTIEGARKQLKAWMANPEPLVSAPVKAAESTKKDAPQAEPAQQNDRETIAFLRKTLQSVRAELHAILVLAEMGQKPAREPISSKK